MEKLKKIKAFDIFTILICFILYGYSIFIGSPLKNNTEIINLIVLLIFVIYVIVNLIKNKSYRIIKNKIDIFIILLEFSSYIALIFKNYSNLEATIEYIIKYTTLLALYLMIRDIVKKDKKYINYIIYTLIFSAITMFVLGLDNLTFNISEKFSKLTNNVLVKNDDKRFWSLFGYANTNAILMVAISIIAVGKYLKSTNTREKIFFNIVIFTNLVAVIMSYSRATWLIAILAYLIFIFFIKKEKTTYIELMLRTRSFKWYI